MGCWHYFGISLCHPTGVKWTVGRGSFAPSSCTAARWPSPWLYLGCVVVPILINILHPDVSISRNVVMTMVTMLWYIHIPFCTYTYYTHTVYAYSTPIPRLPHLVQTGAEFLRWTGLHFPSCPTGFPWPSCITGGKGKGKHWAIGHYSSRMVKTPLLHTVCNRIFTPANSARWILSMDGSLLFLQRLKFAETSSSSVPGLWRWYIIK